MRLIGRLALASASLVVFATPAVAQNTAPGDAVADVPSESGDIIVEARRRDESVQDVPLVVNAVTSESLAKLNIRDLKDISSVVPGLSLVPGANGIGGVATLRGVNFDVNASGNNGTVEFYLNDAPITASVVLQSMYDVGQIEVLRGPQGTLRGRASPSGSITITTRKPDLDEVGGYVNMTGTNLGGLNFNGAINVPIVPGVLAIRVAGLVDDNETNRVRSLNNGVSPLSRTRSERVAVRFTPTDNIDVVGTFQHFINRTRSFDQVESANLITPAPGSVGIRAGDRLAVEDTPREFRQAFDIYNLRAEWRFAGLKLNYVGEYSKQQTTTRQPNDVGNYFGAGYPGSASAANDPFTTGFATVPNLQNAAQFTDSFAYQESHEVRLSSDERLFGAVDFVIGGMINKLRPPFNLWSQTPLFVDIFGNQTATPALAATLLNPAPGVFIPGFLGFANSNITQKNTSTLERSLFGNVTVHIGEATEISGGLRYINFHNHSEKYIQTAAGGPVSPLGKVLDDTFNPVIYSASIKHRFNDNLMVYASTGSSWRASAQTNGIIDRDDIFPYGTLAALLNLPPETSKSYEIGFKSQWLDRRLTLNVSYFHQDFKNYFYSAPNVQIAQRLALGPAGSTTSANVGDVYQLAFAAPALAVGVPVKVDGVEAEFAFRPSSRLSLSGTLSYTVSKIKNGSAPCNLSPLPTTGAGVVAGTGGQQVAMCTVNYSASNSPPFSASLQSEYHAPISTRTDAFLRGQAAIYGNSQNDPSNPLDNVAAYALVNLFAGVRGSDGSWELTAYAKNLFNTERVLSRDANALVTAAQFLAPNFANLGGFPQTTAYRGITMTPPREFGLNMRFAFGSR